MNETRVTFPSREWFQAWSASVVWVELLAFLVSMLMTLIVSLCADSSKLSNSDPDSYVANSGQTEFCDITSYTRQEVSFLCVFLRVSAGRHEKQRQIQTLCSASQSDSAVDLTEFSKNPQLKSPD